MQTVKLKQPKTAILKAVEVLNHGGLVIFPCETVYGVAVDSTNYEAIKKLTKYKQRPFGKPFAIMVNGIEMAKKYVEINQTAKQLYENFLPGPLTIISQGKHQTAPGVESETGTLGVRLPDYPFMRQVIAKFGRPIVATSANASYKRRPYKLSDIWENISAKQRGLIDLVIDAGELPHREPSTVIDTTRGELTTLRQGEVSFSKENSVLSTNEESTRNVGKELWQKYEKYLGQRAIVFALEGEMGAGKTQLTKGLAKAMEIEETIISPTYVLEAEYEKGLVHIDAWRLQQPDELLSMGFGKRIGDKSVVVIEWADRVADVIRKYNEQAVVVWVKIDYGQLHNERIIKWKII